MMVDSAESIETPDTDEGVTRFEDLKNNIPITDDVLLPITGESAKIWKDDRGRGDGLSIYVNACIDTRATGWFLCDDAIGLKCLIAKEQHSKIGDTVNKLKVIRRATSGKALICEIPE